MENFNTKLNDKDMYVETPLGTLHIYKALDPAHPGVYIDLLKKGIPYEAALAVIEYDQDDEDHPETGNISCKTWTDVRREDYTENIVFKNIDEYFKYDATNLSSMLCHAIKKYKSLGGQVKRCAVVNISYADKHYTMRETQLNISERIDTEEGEKELFDLFDSLAEELELPLDYYSAANCVTKVEVVATADSMDKLIEMGF